MLVVCAREEHYHRGAKVRLMKIVEHIMRTQKRIAFSDSSQKYNGVFRCMLLNILNNQAVIFAYLHGVADCLYDPPEAPLLLKVVTLIYKIVLAVFDLSITPAS